MHFIDGQYLKGAKNNKTRPMHDLRAMYEKTLEIAQEVFHEDVNERGDFNFKPRPSKMTDLQVITLAVSSESACIDSENLLFSKLRTDFKIRFPERIRVDNGPEFISQALEDWCSDEQRNIELVFIEKGEPTQNGYVERFNRTYRQEVLDNYCFDSLIQAKALTNAWIWIYNNERPHGSLKSLTPCEFARRHGNKKDEPTVFLDSNNKWSTLVKTVPN